MTMWCLYLLTLCTLSLPPLAPGLSKRRVARVEGDIILGALFPVHRQPSGQKTAYIKQCGEIWEQYGMHRIELFLKTLAEINQDRELLPEVTLGCDIRDSCWYPPVALEQSIDFIKNSITSRENLNKTRQTGSNKPIAGLIGPGSSTVTIQVQNLLSLFNIPQIGYSATSKDLSDKSLYKYFLRVVPSDTLQARALVDLVSHFNWTYISTVYTEGNYGFRGIQEFHAMAEERGLCTGAEEKVYNNGDDASYDLVVDSLRDTHNARVVVCFCEGMSVKNLLKAMARKQVSGQFLVIGSDGWAVRPDVVEGIEDVSVGGISFKLHSPPILDFDDYYFSLNPDQETHNPWFREFWQQKFKCYLTGQDADHRYTKPCTGQEDLSRAEYVQDSKLGFVVNAIYTMAYALDRMHRDLCRGEPGLCAAMDPVNGPIFLEYLLNVSFTSYSNDQLHFNRKGDPPGRYDIMNFQVALSENGSRSYDYVRIGGWDNGNLTVDTERIYWPGQIRSGGPVTESVCSKPCPRGQVKVIQNQVHCCWSCRPCQDNQFLLDEQICKSCPMGWWPNANLTACVLVPLETMKWHDKEAIVSMTFACVGILVVSWVGVVFMRHNNTAVVKASTRELSYIILFGICISYLTTFILVAKPSLVTCYLTRILPGSSFSMIYGALLTKTNRIARILAGSKKKIMTRKPRFMSASAQVLITCVIIAVECAIITLMLILEPADSKLVYPAKRRVALTCNATTMGIIVPLGFDIFLIVMCTLYAIKTRNLPENFNEAKFIGFTMYTTCIIWLAFVPIYFGSDSKVITMCLAITLSASVALILLFFPKIYIIVCKPERNNRSAFTTSKEVRCHIGSSTGLRSVSTDSFDRHIKPFENAALSLYRQKSFFSRWREKTCQGSVSGSPPSGPQPINTTSGNRVTAARAFSRLATGDKKQDPSKRKRLMANLNLDKTARPEAAHPVVQGVTLRHVDSAAQTDDELLEPLLTSLRRRKVSVQDRYSPNKDANSSLNESPDRRASHVYAPIQRRSDDSFGYHTGMPLLSGNECSENMSPFVQLAYSRLEQPVSAGNGSSGAAVETSDQFPAGKGDRFSGVSRGSERSPLLTCTISDISSSEESCGETGDHEDLEDLLLGAKQCHGSFSSVASSFSSTRSSLDFSPQTRTLDFSPSPQAHTLDFSPSPQTHTREFSPHSSPHALGFHNQSMDDPSVDINNECSKSTKLAQPAVGAAFLGYEHDLCALGEPAPAYNIPEKPKNADERNWMEPAHLLSGVTSGQADLDLAGSLAVFGSFGRPESVTGPEMGPCGERSERGEDTDLTGPRAEFDSFRGAESVGGPDMGPCGGRSDPEDDMDLMEAMRLDSRSHHGLAKEDSVTKFQEYLRSRGLDLDLTSVQSSDV